jgi:hypothetical protein
MLMSPGNSPTNLIVPIKCYLKYGSIAVKCRYRDGTGSHQGTGGSALGSTNPTDRPKVFPIRNVEEKIFRPSQDQRAGRIVPNMSTNMDMSHSTGSFT